MEDILLPIFPIHLLENIHFSHHPHVRTRKFSLIFSCNYNLKMMRENFFSLEGKTYLNLTSSCDVFSLIFSTNCFSENVNTTIFIYFRLIPWRRDPKISHFLIYYTYSSVSMYYILYKYFLSRRENLFNFHLAQVEIRLVYLLHSINNKVLNYFH